MKSKGFTLIELILVITLLGIIALIAVPTVNKILNHSKEEATKEQQRIAIKAAKTYMVGHSEKYPDSKCYIESSTLIAEGIIDEEFKDPNNKQQICKYIIVSQESGKYKYKCSNNIEETEC